MDVPRLSKKQIPVMSGSAPDGIMILQLRVAAGLVSAGGDASDKSVASSLLLVGDEPPPYACCILHS